MTEDVTLEFIAKRLERIQSGQAEMRSVINRAPVEHGATADEPALIDATAPAFAIGQHVKAVLDHCGEQFRAPAAAVETMVTRRSPTTSRTSRSSRGKAFVNAASTSPVTTSNGSPEQSLIQRVP
jgi:hypothetical protein